MTGPPGTGKTSVISASVQTWLLRQRRAAVHLRLRQEQRRLPKHRRLAHGHGLRRLSPHRLERLLHRLARAPLLAQEAARRFEPAWRAHRARGDGRAHGWRACHYLHARHALERQPHGQRLLHLVQAVLLAHRRGEPDPLRRATVRARPLQAHPDERRLFRRQPPTRAVPRNPSPRDQVDL